MQHVLQHYPNKQIKTYTLEMVSMWTAYGDISEWQKFKEMTFSSMTCPYQQSKVHKELIYSVWKKHDKQSSDVDSTEQP